MEIVSTPTATIVSLSGSFDADAVAAQGRLWDELPQDSKGDLCLDLTQVTFIDSAAIGTIAFLFKRLATQGRELQLVGVAGQPRSLLKLLRVDRVIAMTPACPRQPGAARLDAEKAMAGEVA